jgi:hypothetical protein
METRFGDLALDIRNPDHWSEDRLLIWTGGYGICPKRLTVPREADRRDRADQSLFPSKGFAT